MHGLSILKGNNARHPITKLWDDSPIANPPIRLNDTP